MSELRSLVGLIVLLAGCGESAVGDPPGGSGAAGGSLATGGAAGSDTVAGTGGGSPQSGGSGGVGALGGGAGAGSGGTDAVVGGNGGAAGAASLCSAGDCSAAVGDMDGYVYQYPGGTCVDKKLTVTHEFTVKGDAARVYRVALRIRGVTESKNYEGGMRRSAAPLDPGASGGDLWYEGGIVPLSSYGSYELHVTPAVTGAPNDYYLNARDGTDEHDATTWALKYDAEVKVQGGGKVTFRAFDSNCSAINNCGPKGGSCTPRTLDLSDAVPAATLVQPPRDAADKSVQWLHIDVTGVDAL